MATTDTKPGFRLPWATDRADADGADGSQAATSGTETPTDVAPGADAPEVGAESGEPAAAVVGETLVEAGSAPEADAANVEASATTEAPAADDAPAVEAPVAEAPVPEAPATIDVPVDAEPIAATLPEVKAPATVSRKPNKFLADLTRAMQTTAEAERSQTMERFAADAKIAVERVHTAAADETTELRRVADDDVAGIREWSKAEIARIREETENRISGRKADLERELELHAGTVEQRIERVTARVASFETEVADFYERLFAEEDPARFAAMAEQLPEPPSLDLPGLDDAVMIGMPTRAVEAAATEVAAVPDVVADQAPDTEAVADAVDASPEPGTVDAVQPAADATLAADDPRLGALETSTDFAAAEAEASLAEAVTVDAGDEIPTIDDEVLAARLAGLVPDENADSNPIHTTKVVVTGLVSVASIAGFKRHLGRLQGVTTVGVSSGPDGEFVFSVHHLPTIDLAAGISGLPGFETRITSQGDGAIEVAARDPEAHD